MYHNAKCKSKVLANLTVLCHKYYVTGNGNIMQSNVGVLFQFVTSFLEICQEIKRHYCIEDVRTYIVQKECQLAFVITLSLMVIK